jgi:alpha-tubulin suppressor-like RCC1 family protein
LHEDGTVWCWGSNNHGQLGNGTTVPVSVVPVQVTGIDSAVAIAAGGTWNAGGKGAANSTFNCAVLRGGSVQCWGAAPGNSGVSSVPVLVPGIDHAVAVAGGNSHACALLQSGSIQCWGSNNHGQLGNGSLTSSLAPVTVLGISNATEVVGLGSDFTCALLTGGSVECWGDQWFDSNVNPSVIDSSTPNAILLDGPAPVRIAAGYHNACAVSPDGGVQCWTGVSPDRPVTVPGVKSAKAVAVGLSHACALLSDGTIQCWGQNQYGLFGNPSGAPAAVSGISDAVAVSAGYGYSCALLKAGSAWCWGPAGLGTPGVVGDTPVEVRGF